MDHNLVTTAFTVDGYKITKNIGVVEVTKLLTLIVRDYSASLQTLVGGNTHCSPSCAKNPHDA
jgi:uncharacterized protein YbjQ (UPF0145 family)